MNGKYKYDLAGQNCALNKYMLSASGLNFSRLEEICFSDEVYLEYDYVIKRSEDNTKYSGGYNNLTCIPQNINKFDSLVSVSFQNNNIRILQN